MGGHEIYGGVYITSTSNELQLRTPSPNGVHWQSARRTTQLNDNLSLTVPDKQKISSILQQNTSSY